MICLCEHLFQQLALTFTPGNSCQGPEALLEIRHSLEKAHTSYIHSKEALKPEVRRETPEAWFTLHRALSWNAFVHFVLVKGCSSGQECYVRQGRKNLERFWEAHRKSNARPSCHAGSPEARDRRGPFSAKLLLPRYFTKIEGNPQTTQACLS